MPTDLDALVRLAATIESRKTADPAVSYTATLVADPRLAARKLGEEAVETVIASLSGEPSEVVAEAADLVYHLLAVLAARGISLADVAAELERREGRSGHAEKAAR